jgi:hypothetical protein
LAQVRSQRRSILSPSSKAKSAASGFCRYLIVHLPWNPPYFGAHLQGISELGYVEGKNLVIEWCFADSKVVRADKVIE